jgi:hypothetical protein
MIVTKNRMDAARFVLHHCWYLRDSRHSQVEIMGRHRGRPANILLNGNGQNIGG